MEEYLIGGIAACGAGLFTNPLEVAKTRQQLQGELRARGQYKVHYRHVLHAFYTIGRVEGLFALQKGLSPALFYQFFMNGCRLGSYQCLTNLGLTKDSNNKTSLPRCAIAGGISGTIGACIGSPFYLVCYTGVLKFNPIVFVACIYVYVDYSPIDLCLLSGKNTTSSVRG